MTPKYFRLGRDLIVAPPILRVVVSTFCLLLIRTASVLCAAKASSLESSHALARFPASLQNLSASGTFFAVTTMATSGNESGIVILRISSYMTFHNNGPGTDPWGTFNIQRCRYTVLLSAVQPPFPLNGLVAQFTDGVDGKTLLHLWEAVEFEKGTF